MKEIWSEQIKLGSHDVDHKAFWTPYSIFYNMQEVANDHTEILGVSWNDLMGKYNVCWVLTRMRVEMLKYPKAGDTITITTWPDSKAKAIFTRYFTYKDSNENLLGSATSQWVLFDTVNRVMVKPKDYNIPMPDTSMYQIPFALPKVNFDFSAEHSLFKAPSYSDLDYNGHVNNAKYIQWIYDILGYDVFDKMSVSTVDIKYCSEIQYRENITITYSEILTDPTEFPFVFYVKGFGNDNRLCFEAVLALNKKASTF
ncbi:MAG: hypothetical protein LBI03_02690 [Clostridiales bacterium]|jgi:acyl-ACP thioesterase|nr:hypothetical protein [Clostridiales bacterium]